tara:strand:- start:58 stop:240 length:183 start_codon:yes stop_codon:yes gene_type:complete
VEFSREIIPYYLFMQQIPLGFCGQKVARPEARCFVLLWTLIDVSGHFEFDRLYDDKELSG